LDFDELTLDLNSHNSNFDLIVLSEKWLLSDFKLNLQEYQIINSVGSLNKSDGITILLKENIKVSCINTTILSNCNFLEIKHQLFDKQYVLIRIYRSPNDNNDLFINGFHLYLSGTSDKECIILCDDNNIDILVNFSHSTDYLNIMSRYNFIFCILMIILVYLTIRKCIDHIFIRNINACTIKSYIVKCDITDHYLTIIFIDIQDGCSTNYNNTSISPDFRYKTDYEHLNILINKKLGCYYKSYRC